MGVGFLEPPRFNFVCNCKPRHPEKYLKNPPYNSSSRISCADLETFWKLGSKKSQIEIVSLSGFHQANLRHTHLGDPHVPSKYSRKHHRDYPPANGGKPLEARFELISWRSSGNPTLRSLLGICGWFYQLKKKNSATFAYTIPLDPKNP